MDEARVQVTAGQIDNIASGIQVAYEQHGIAFGYAVFRNEEQVACFSSERDADVCRMAIFLAVEDERKEQLDEAIAELQKREIRPCVKCIQILEQLKSKISS